MKFTKFSHSCVLVESAETTILFDPGEFSWSEGLIQKKIAELTRLDTVYVTHVHPDHCFSLALRAIREKFPDVIIVTTKEAQLQLAEDSIETVVTLSNNLVTLKQTDHAHLNKTIPIFENMQVILKNIITHPGDSMNIEQLKTPVIALPFFGPWENGTFTDAMNLAIKLRPEYIIPIHDYHYKPEFRDDFYERAQKIADAWGGKVICKKDAKPATVMTNLD